MTTSGTKGSAKKPAACKVSRTEVKNRSRGAVRKPEGAAEPTFDGSQYQFVTVNAGFMAAMGSCSSQRPLPLAVATTW